MYCKLDWFSFTFPISLQGEKDNEYTLNAILLAFHDHTSHSFLRIATARLWQWEAPAGFYTNRIKCPKSSIQIQWSAGNPFALCVLSGQACDMVLKSISVAELARSANGRCTRCDFAVDIETAQQPKEFIDAGWSDAFKSSGHVESPTGTTYYVGSRNAERMARVYRYASPHPRSHLLRVEAEYKGDAAKMSCQHLVEHSLTQVTLSAHLPFGWRSPVWQPGNIEISKIPARKYDREGAGTLRWLELSVVPALKSAHKEGLISLKQWFDDHFHDLLK
jgi:hypothetical protein